MTKLAESDSKKLLLELQAIDFALVELTLYLDTHPDDAKILKQHTDLAEKRKDIRHQYEVLAGPLSNYETGDTLNWQWSQGPWPWQI